MRRSTSSSHLRRRRICEFARMAVMRIAWADRLRDEAARCFRIAAALSPSTPWRRHIEEVAESLMQEASVMEETLGRARPQRDGEAAT
jgi:hypothetical protein